MSFPLFDELRPIDSLNKKMSDAHYSAYMLIKELNTRKFKNELNEYKNDSIQVATSESLTGGLLFSTLVNIPFGGKYKYGAFSVYDTDAKRIFNGVDVDDVYTHKCASQMAVGILLNSNATFGISVTGNAMPYQQDKKNMNQLGEVFIGLACYILQDGVVKILTETYVHNMCNDSITKEKIRICELFYNNIEDENIFKSIIDEKEEYLVDVKDKIEKIKELYNGFNSFEITSLTSNYIRYTTVDIAFQFATKFIKNNYDKMIIPSFINQSKINSQTKLKSINYIEGQHFSNKSNNIILDELSRRNIQIIINNPNAINHDRINKDKYINNEQYKQKYLKYKQKYLKMRNQLT